MSITALFYDQMISPRPPPCVRRLCIKLFDQIIFSLNFTNLDLVLAVDCCLFFSEKYEKRQLVSWFISEKNIWLFDYTITFQEQTSMRLYSEIMIVNWKNKTPKCVSGTCWARVDTSQMTGVIGLHLYDVLRLWMTWSSIQEATLTYHRTHLFYVHSLEVVSYKISAIITWIVC